MAASVASAGALAAWWVITRNYLVPDRTVLHFSRLGSDRRILTPKQVVTFFRSSHFRKRMQDIMSTNLTVTNPTVRIIDVEAARDTVNVTIITTPGLTIRDFVGALKHHYNAGGLLMNSKHDDYELIGYS